MFACVCVGGEGGRGHCVYVGGAGTRGGGGDACVCLCVCGGGDHLLILQCQFRCRAALRLSVAMYSLAGQALLDRHYSETYCHM